jgi:hypothetical protein
VEGTGVEGVESVRIVADLTAGDLVGLRAVGRDLGGEATSDDPCSGDLFVAVAGVELGELASSMAVATPKADHADLDSAEHF